LKLQYDAATAITLTLTSLASGAARQSAKVDNTTNLYLDALIEPAAIKTATGTLATGAVVSIYAYGSIDGTTWADGLTGSDAAWTPPTNITGRLIAQVPIDTAATAKTFNSASVALAFGGTLPPFWVIAAVNSTGLALDGAAGGSVSYAGVKTQ
jgi:hypothetical protein